MIASSPRGGAEVENYELREEIRHGGASYFLQTSYNSESGQIQSSFFRDGAMFDSVVMDIDGEPVPSRLRELTKEIHQNSKRNFRVLLAARDRIGRASDPAPHLRLAEALLGRNLFIEAMQEAESAIEKGSKDSRAWMVIAESRYRLGQYEPALAAVDTGIRLSPDYPDLLNLKGRIHLKRRQCSEAVKSFTRAIELNMYYGEPYLNLIRAYLLNTIIKQDYDLSRGLDEKLKKNLDRVRQLNPFVRPEKLEEARALFEQQSYEEALEILDGLEAAGSRDPVDDIMLELYLSLLQGAEEFEDAQIESFLDRIREILDRNPTYADAWNSLGILYTAKCKIFMDKSREAFQKALEINDGYGKARKNLRLTENDRQGIFILLKALLD
jgi:Tfp pilus assembly protein PilF